MIEELPSQADRAQRQTKHVANVTALGDRQLAATPTKVNQENIGGAEARVGQEAEVNKPALFQARNSFHLPANRGLHPGKKSRRVARLPERARAHNSHPAAAITPEHTMKPAQHVDSSVHRLRRERALPEHGFPQTGDKPVFVHRLEAMMDDARHFEAHGVGTDVDRSKDTHVRWLALRRLRWMM